MKLANSLISKCANEMKGEFRTTCSRGVMLRIRGVSLRSMGEYQFANETMYVLIFSHKASISILSPLTVRWA